MWIRFTTKLTRRGDAQEPIATAEIYTPREGFGVGVYPEGADAGRGEAGPLFAPAEDEKPKPEPKTKVRDEDMVYRVGGQVSRISRLGELTINAGGTSVKATLAEDAKLSVDVADLSFLRVGDNIEVRGWYPAGTKGRAIATQVTASSAEPSAAPRLAEGTDLRSLEAAEEWRRSAVSDGAHDRSRDRLRSPCLQPCQHRSPRRRVRADVQQRLDR
jgi:hypothetical protein